MNLSATSYHRMLVVSVLVVLVGALAIAQPKYRTFNQVDLAEKKQKKAGKQVSSDACFHFVNTTGITVNSLHARFNGRVLSIQDSGGFTSIDFDHKHKAIDATGRTVAPGDSVVFCGTFDKKDSAIHVNFWRWDTNGVPASPKYDDLEPWSVQGNRIQPNGGTVREYLYKKVITRPAGLVIGLPNPTTGGWIRYKTADRKYFPHTDSSRCFDFIKSGEGNQHPFIGELKNPHVKKHNNHLLGEVHALRLAIVANDSGVTSPFDASTRLGDLHYSGAGDDPCNGLTVRQI
ncbi:MAG: hypothetical protein HY277_09870, partial [Ignavibacteriales bacterium]|nr:hypothetical protein [Ignavibacteriales bacterium]